MRPVEGASSFVKSSQASEEARLFQTVIEAFAVAGVEDSKKWPSIISGFEVAFEQSRIDRSAYTPYLNILDVFGIKLRELRHSSVVEWFLKEDAEHEQGALFLNALAAHLGETNADFTKYHTQREKPDNVDIAAYKRDEFAIFIENKVKSGERPEQMTKLINALVKHGTKQNIGVDRRFAILLTESGGEAKTAPSVMPNGFNRNNLREMDRLTLFNVFSAALENVKASHKSLLLVAFLGNYIETISTHPGAML
jgi:hypothetical protein